MEPRFLVTRSPAGAYELELTPFDPPLLNRIDYTGRIAQKP